jgi:predicted nucleic acid-binding protein
MTGPVFVDANVFVYARDGRAAAKQARAAAWIAHLWREGLGRTSMQVISESYTTETRKLVPRVAADDAWEDVKALFTWRPQPIDASLLARAREIERRWQLSWWDGMVVAAAQLQGCSILLTEDLQDGAVFDGVTVRSPFTLDAREPQAVYSVAPVMASRHRPRGRPRKAVAGGTV